MGRNKKPHNILKDILITDVAAEGKALCRIEERVLFVTGAVPGDICDIEVTKKRSSYWEGKVVNLVKPSDIRIEPTCEYFGVCGGCKWQHMPYEKQCEFKQREVVQNLKRLGHLELPAERAICACEQQLGYRNKLEYTFSNRRWLTNEEVKSGKSFAMDCAGFHVPGLFDKVVDIEKCYLQSDISNQIRNYIRDYGREHSLSFYDIRAQEGFLRTLIIRNTSLGHLMVIVTFGRNEEENIKAIMEGLKNNFKQITSLMYVVNTKMNDTITDQEVILYHGEPFITEQMEDVKFRVGPKSFYQTNSPQAYNLYKITREFAHLTGSENVYDLYTGTGTIANFVARHCKNVVGIEYIPEAIEDAKLNSQLNNITNTKFYAGDMKDVLTNEFIAQHGKPDVMIVDPPRAGMHPSVVETILNAAPERIVYVSCNSATQARDLQMMQEQYEVVELQAVDMFPQTHHVESVVGLRKKATV